MAPDSPPKPGDFVAPMLAVTAKAPFSGADWWFETKWDGYRAIISAGSTFRIYSRRGHDLIRWYPEMGAVREYIPDDTVLDAELVAWVDGRPAFDALQNHSADHYFLMVFDCLYAGGQWLLHEPLERRLETLHKIVSSHGPVIVSDGVIRDGEAFFDASARLGMEGVMAKRLDSRYLPGQRSPRWQKLLVLSTLWLWVVARERSPSGQWYWHLAQLSDAGWTKVAVVPVPKSVKIDSAWSHQPVLVKPFQVQVEYREKTREGHLRHARLRQWEKPGMAQNSSPRPPSLS